MPRSSWWLGLCTAAGLAAQTDGALRGAAVGEVRDRDGKPWASAEVVLRSRPLSADANAGDEDVVTAITDERGRFHADVLRGRPYSAWAWAAPDANGRRATAVVELAFAQRPIVLRETRMLPRRRAVLAQTQRWPEASFALRVVDGTGNRGVSWVDVCDGEAALPWLVGDEAYVELFAVQKQLRVPLRRDRLAADAADLRLDVPERRRATCWARKAGTPCADCEVLHGLGDALFAAGRTDSGGKLEFDLPVREPRDRDLRLLVRGEGMTVGCCAEIERDQHGPALDLPQGAQFGDWFANVESGRGVSLRVLGGDGQPLARVPVWAAGGAINRPSRSSLSYYRWRGALTTDTNGDARVLGLGPGSVPQAHLLLPEHALATLPPAWRSGLVPVVLAPLVDAAGDGARETPYIVDLRRMCPLELQLTLPNGDPAAFAELGFMVLEPCVESPWSWGPDTLHADQVGRVRILVPSDVHLGVRAVHGASLLIRGLATFGGRIAAGPAVVTLRLPPPAAIRGRLVDKTDAPMAGRVVMPSPGEDNQAMEWNWTTEPCTAPAAQNRAHVLLPDSEQERRTLSFLMSHAVRTDADGCFVLPLPACPIPGLRLFESEPGATGVFDSMLVSWTGASIDDLVFHSRL